ncbi:hypothetical protein F5Y03DRAFT_385061 [Xylaria venustula]|nr:hypothetical protein F5Y03DRAFT_385061 [Xylaria venustula]
MASSSAAVTGDAPINLKINFNGTTRRFKLPLRDVGANVFEDKIRGLLNISPDTPTIIERYSDSATSYVILHPLNTPVYKQLYRAAKAKQKLKLRVTTKSPESVRESVAPKPVTIEDEPEEEAERVTPAEAKKESEKEVKDETVQLSPSETPAVVETVIAPQVRQDFPPFVKQWRARGNPRIHLRRNGDGVEVIDFLASSTAEPVTNVDSPEGSNSTNIAGSDSPISLAQLMRDVEERESKGAAIKTANFRDIQESHERDLEPHNHMVPITQKKDDKPTELTVQHECMKRPFTVCCNSCDRAVPEAHFHCSICDEGDFDLCQECVNRGVSCYGEGHWLIKRTVVNGDIKCSSTHIAPKSIRSNPLKLASKPTSPTTTASSNTPSNSRAVLALSDLMPHVPARTCNCCVQEFREEQFVHCTVCDDYDLCYTCFAKNQHGHHPKHGFVPAVKGSVLDQAVSTRLAPGRNVLHNAICDGCDKYVRGIRHKCLDCPDWDYCSDCAKDANFIHPNHRFVAIYEPLADRPFRNSSRATHYGISCDGPLCKARDSGSKYIVGERYKCAVCHDTDFCANCEASPANTHNKTHPLIKFKTPVRHVSVTTTGEHEDGQRLPTMGDRCHRPRTTTARALDTTASPVEKMTETTMQTVVNVQPTEQQTVQPPNDDNKTDDIKQDASETKSSVSVKSSKESVVNNDLVAIFKWDTIQDGSVLPPNHTFEQTWVLRNEGTVPWPAGCSVKFVGGDYMGAVDPAHPAGIHELVSASESTICYNALNPGQEFPFTVLMRTPDRDGKVISYWRLTTPGGIKFGHKLWCDVTVQASLKAEQVKAQISDAAEPESEVEETISPTVSESRMIIPKLEHESPSASVSMEGAAETEVETETDTLAPSAGDDDDFEDCGQDDWAEDSASGFFTDEEYDILDASDEEFLVEQQKKLSKK